MHLLTLACGGGGGVKSFFGVLRQAASCGSTDSVCLHTVIFLCYGTSDRPTVPFIWVRNTCRVAALSRHVSSRAAAPSEEIDVDMQQFAHMTDQRRLAVPLLRILLYSHRQTIPQQTA